MTDDARAVLLGIGLGLVVLTMVFAGLAAYLVDSLRRLKDRIRRLEERMSQANPEL